MSRVRVTISWAIVSILSFNMSPDSIGQDAVERIARIEAALDAPLKHRLQFEDRPFCEILDLLSEEYEIPIIVDAAALDKVAVSPDTEIAINLSNISLKSALNLILKQPGLEDLVYSIDNEVLLVSTEEAINCRLVVEIYDVEDLAVELGIVGTADKPYSSLVDVIVSCVEFDSWRENGNGEGEIHLLRPNLLVVAQTHAVHVKIKQLLKMVRKHALAPVQSKASAEAAVHSL